MLRLIVRRFFLLLDVSLRRLVCRVMRLMLVIRFLICARGGAWVVSVFRGGVVMILNRRLVIAGLFRSGVRRCLRGWLLWLMRRLLASLRARMLWVGLLRVGGLRVRGRRKLRGEFVSC